MTDPRTTNQKIADLIKEQTYDERIEMAEWFRDVAHDAWVEYQGVALAVLTAALSTEQGETP